MKGSAHDNIGIYLGTALCHFALAVKESDIKISFSMSDTGIMTDAAPIGTRSQLYGQL